MMNEAEERTAFEAWAAKKWPNSHPPHSAWDGWKARAALAAPQPGSLPAGVGVLRNMWDQATNAVCQTMQDRDMCKCASGECVAATINPSPQDFALAAPQPVSLPAGVPSQEQMNQAFYVDVCQAEDRLREFIEASRKLLKSLPAHWHSDDIIELGDLADETSAVLNPHMHTPYQVEQATKRYGRSALAARPTPEAQGEADALAILLTNCAGILDVVKGEWSMDGSWSEYDQSVRDRITHFLERHHQRRFLAAQPASDAAPTEPVEARGDGWIEWKGGECPVALEVLVDVEHRGDKTISKATAAGFWGDWWKHKGDYLSHEIVAYRLTPQAEKGA